MPLATAAEYKLAYPDAAAADDAAVEGWLSAAQAAMEAHARRRFDEQPHVERTASLDGFLYLSERPVTVLASVEAEGGTVGTWTALEAGRYELLDPGRGVVAGPFARGHGCRARTYRVTYTAGYATPPADLKQLCILAARSLGQVAAGSASGALKSVSLGNQSFSYAGGDAWEAGPMSPLPPAVVAGLRPYASHRR